MAGKKREVDIETSILIVDDSESICKSLSLILKRKGYETETANSGQEALKKAQKKSFNIALLDIRLPDIEGIELLKQFKETYPDMAIVMVTGYASVENVTQALNYEAEAYITKPLNMFR